MEKSFYVYGLNLGYLVCLQEQVIKVIEAEISPVLQFILWVWNGSRYSGLVCMALSSTIYFLMEVLSDAFTG